MVLNITGNPGDVGREVLGECEFDPNVDGGIELLETFREGDGG